MKKHVAPTKENVTFKKYIATNIYNIIAITLVIVVFGAAYLLSTDQGKSLVGIHVNPLASYASGK